MFHGYKPYGIIFFITIIVLLSPMGIACADGYLTYTSNVIYESNTSGYDYGIHVGDILTHTYLIDKSRPGIYNLNGSQTVMPDKYYINDQIAEDAYYSDLVSGPLLINPLYPPCSDAVTDDRYSIDYYDEQGNYYRTISWAGDDWGSHLFNYSRYVEGAERGLLVYHNRIDDVTLHRR